ncbi:dihydrodipicolinate synthase family protein [Luteimonas sp. RIT-PG2_3]
MFSGLSAFPLTPMNEDGIDEAAFAGLVQRLAAAGVDSIGALGSTGSYAYLDHAERARVARLAVMHAGDVPVIVGIGALRTRDVLALAEDAQRAGASGVLLAPVSYQTLTPDEVFGLYEQVTRHLSIPLCVYDNPGTTRFEFSDELHGRIAQLPNVASIKIPGVPADPDAARARVQRLRAQVPAKVTIGVSGDASAARGLNAGCEAWYSVIGGLFPNTALAITRAAQTGHAAEATRLSQRLQPLWALFDQHGGSLRVVAAAAELLGRVERPCLPLPLKALDDTARVALVAVLEALARDARGLDAAELQA